MQKKQQASWPRRIIHIAAREIGHITHMPIYLFCMIVFPVIIIIFFTSLMSEGLPQKLPCGIVDNDNTSLSRKLAHQLDAFQETDLVARYPNVSQARQDIQRGRIYAFLYIPKGTTEKLISQRQPKISFYYSNVTLMAGSMLFKDLKTISTLGSAAIGAAKMQMLGKTQREIKNTLQPITLDLHMIGNPWMNYNIYLSTIMIPGILVLFMLLITAYSIGTELKFGRAREWMRLSGNNILIALAGKLIPQFLIFLSIFLAFEWYIYGYLAFPHPGGTARIILAAILTVASSQGFGVFIFGLLPSLRMSMSICSLWAVVGFSACGATYPLFAMDSMIEAVAQLIPLRHYYMFYRVCIFNDYPLVDAWWNVVAFTAFATSPILTMRNLKRAMLEYVYIP